MMNISVRWYGMTSTSLSGIFEKPIKKDSESAPQTTVANELKENLEAVENFKGSRDEKLVVLYCKQLGINYKKSVRRRISLVDSDSQKIKEKWERLSAKGKNGKEKPLLHGLLASM